MTAYSLKNPDKGMPFYFSYDLWLLLALLLLTGIGFILLYSISQNSQLVIHQAFHIALSYLVMFALAQIRPHTYQRYSFFIYSAGILLLLAVLLMGHIGLGARRWIAIGPLHFQPSELLKLAIPMVLATRFSEKSLPPTYREIAISTLLIVVPAALTIQQPDLGTAILLIIAGISTLFLAGIRFRFILSCLLLLALAAPLIWHHLHDYQQERILTFISPERDPLDAGYHIIQSKIAIGSGGLLGEGFMKTTQSQLHFLPEDTTDFIFSAIIEEFGFVGALVLMGLYALIILRCLIITRYAQDTFSRLLAGSLTFTFFISVFINMGMVCGIIPVVGLPLPLVSYGGTSMLMLLANFGILMSIQSQRNLITR